jgi:23S rRNA pseudouridine1911/1915/1917 synthase
MRPAPESGALDVVYEDDVLLILNKPAGVVVHPSYKQRSGTLLNAVLWRMHESSARPGILTRLDKDTSGLVVVALAAEAHAALQRSAAAGFIRKEYLAIVRGTPKPPRGRIELPLGRDPRDRRRVVITPGGAPSDTRYEVLASLPETRALVRCEIVTGRTHQIRVHLAARGWPIVGDAVYGERDPAIARQALHAWRIALSHPVTGERMQFEAPLPEDMRVLLSPKPARDDGGEGGR